MDLKLDAEPTFTAKVGIPVPGRGHVDVEFTFKHRTKDEFAEFRSKRETLSDVDYVLEIATAWQLKDAFNRDNVARLLQSYHGAAVAIAVIYTHELMGARLKN